MSVQRADRGRSTPFTRRAAVATGLMLASGALAAASARPAFAATLRQATPVAGTTGDDPEAIIALARDIMEQQHVKAVILRVTIDGQELVTEALGESMTGVPATTEMHFRNGAVAFFYVSTLLLRLVDQQVVTLDDTIDTWLPDLPDADQVTLRMLANLTAGYPDFVQNPKLSQELYADPFRQWTPQEQIALGSLHAAGLRSRDQLGLLAHRLCHFGTSAGEDHRSAAGRCPARAGPRSHGLTEYRRVGDPGDLRASPARLQRGAAAGPRHPRRHAIPRGVDLLEPVLVLRSGARSRRPTSSI